MLVNKWMNDCPFLAMNHCSMLKIGVLYHRALTLQVATCEGFLSNTYTAITQLLET